MLCTIHSISAIFGGGLKNTPLPTKVLRPKKATKECFIMQNVSGGEEENGHGWLKKNEVLRGEVPFKSYWKDSTQVEIDE